MTFIDEMRRRAKELRDNAHVLLDGDDINTNASKQCAATAGVAAGLVIGALADVVQYQKEGDKVDAAADRRKAILERSDAIRRAAASGNWDAFDHLVAGFGEDYTAGGGTGGIGEEGGD